MNAEGYSKKLFIVFVSACITAGASSSLAYGAYRSLPVDDMFEEQIAELQESIDQARQGNSELDEENENLRQEVEQLEQSILKVQEAQDNVEKAPAVEPKDFAALEEKENALYEQRYQNLLTRKSRLQEQNERQLERIKYFENDTAEAQKTVNQLKAEIQNLQPSVVSKTKKNKSNVPANSVLSSQIQDVAQNQKELQKQIAKEKGALDKVLTEQNQVAKTHASLQAELNTHQDKLKKLQGKVKLLDREVNAASSVSPVEVETLTQEVSDLENYSRELKANLARLKRTAASIQDNSIAEEKKLTAHIKSLEQQQDLLRQQLKITAPDALPPVALEELLNRKSKLVQEHKRLQEQVAGEQKKSAPKPPVLKSSGKNFSAELAQSEARVKALQEKVNLAKNSSLNNTNKNTQTRYLESQAAGLEKQLQNLRESSAVVVPKTGPEDITKLKESIKQLEAHKSILLNSLKQINSKYKTMDLTAKGLGAPENQLTEYLNMLSRENAALQQKLLTIQMQQDRNN